jgi:hypothetical protein
MSILLMERNAEFGIVRSTLMFVQNIATFSVNKRTKIMNVLEIAKFFQLFFSPHGAGDSNVDSSIVRQKFDAGIGV